MSGLFTLRNTTTSLKPVRFLFVMSCLFFASVVNGQTVFWTETFEANPCSSGCDPSTIAWTTTNTGANSGLANKWYVSCAENGQAATVCGAGCGSDESLHMGSTSLGDIGAAYDASQTTNKRVESPIVNCSGKSTISISFNYITFGDAGIDYASLMYFNGSAWSNLTNMAQTTCCGGACNGSRQGRWTAFNMTLPASANNNANVRIGFNWTNNNASGTDPSFAVDDISIAYVTLLPIELISFTATNIGSEVKLNWSTAAEINNDFFTIERSLDAIHFEPIILKDGAGNSSHRINYTDIDHQPLSGKSYYRLKQTDFNGDESYSEVVPVDFDDGLNDLIIYPNPSNGEFTFLTNNPDEELIEIKIRDMKGAVVYSTGFSSSQVKINLTELPAGIYLVETTSSGIVSKKKIVISR